MKAHRSGIFLDPQTAVATTDAIIKAIANVNSTAALDELMADLTHELGFGYFALIHHADLRGAPPDRVDIKRYPDAAVERIVEQATWRRDPIIRACVFAPHAFIWSRLSSIIQLDRRDIDCLALGARDGLNEGISVPCFTLGATMGSCTFAGTRNPDRAPHLVGIAHMVGTFAFQAAKRLVGCVVVPMPGPRLAPRPRDCIVLAGRGFSNKQIARALDLKPRTVDGYLTEARYLLDVHDRTELVVAAVLAGEIGLDEIKIVQPR